MALELLVRLRGVDGRCVVRLRFMSRGSTRLVRRWRRECDGERGMDGRHDGDCDGDAGVMLM